MLNDKSFVKSCYKNHNNKKIFLTTKRDLNRKEGFWLWVSTDDADPDLFSKWAWGIYRRYADPKYRQKSYLKNGLPR